MAHVVLDSGKSELSIALLQSVSDEKYFAAASGKPSNGRISVNFGRILLKLGHQVSVAERH